MLLLIFKIIVIVILTAKIVDFVEDKGHRSLWVKIGTPLMWIAGEFIGRVAAAIVTGVTAEEVTDPTFSLSVEGSNFLFLSGLLAIVGGFVAVGALYLYARSLRTLAEPDQDVSFS